LELLNECAGILFDFRELVDRRGNAPDIIRRPTSLQRSDVAGQPIE
jgi:hypothetical protein